MNALELPSRFASAAPMIRQAATGAEAARQLESLIHEAVSTDTARQALLLRLSTLPRALAQPHHLRLAVEALEPLLAADRARLFLLPGRDAAIVWRGPAPAALAEAMDRLHLLFAHTPPGDGVASIARHLTLPADADLLLAAVNASRHKPPPIVPPPARTPLDPASLTALEAALERADLSRFARRRPVCVLSHGQGLMLAWEMRQFCLHELAETLAPERDLKAEPWLFRRLTRMLDQRMMALLAAPQELDGAGPFGLALNIASILSPAFLRFDTALPARLRGQVVITLRPEDVLTDPPAFIFARGFVSARGYRLLLGGITPTTAGAFPPDATGIDHLQLAWRPELAGTDLATLGLAARRTVLGGVDSIAALDWARVQAIPLLTGSIVRPAR